MKIHKYFRKLKTSNQYILCTGKKCDYSEKVSYFWKKVDCKKCLAMKK